MKLLPLLCLLLLAGTAALAQGGAAAIPVVGRVTEAAGGGPLRLVTVRVEGTTKGAMTNADGRFLLRLAPGNHTLAFSMIGYRTERRSVLVESDTARIDVALEAAVFQTPELVVSAEDPGVRMMRAAIARKMRQRDSLETYSYRLYTKFVAGTDTLTAGRSSGRSDTTIVSIFESFSVGYYRRPDSYFNEIIQRRQTANIPPEGNVVAFGTNLNVYDDYVEILGEQIATPFHPDALDYYDFVLEQTIRDDSLVVDRISATPKSNARKLFSGVIDLDSRRAIPLSVELKPNRAVQLPFDAELAYRQKFEEVDRFVLPSGLYIYASLQASLFWIIAPRLDVSIETVAYDHACNIPLDGDLFAQRRVEAAPSADTFDSTFWREGAVLPLRPEELAAYDQIRMAQENPDSLESSGLLDEIFGAIPRTIGRLNRKPFTGFEDVFRYNRVHGAYLGLGLTGEILPSLDATIRGGYGTADRRGYGELALKKYLDQGRRLALSGSLYRRLARRDNPYIVTGAAITPLALLAKNDYGDYYHADGFELGAGAGFGQLRFIKRDLFVHPTGIRLFFRNERQSTAAGNATFAIFGRGRQFRENPAVFDGVMRSAGFELNYNYSPMRRIGNVGFQIAGEFSNPSIVPSDFSFEQYYGALILRTPTLPLWRLDMRLSGGYSHGRIPPQRFFSLESAVSSLAGEAVFRGMEVKEFYGDRYAALSLEHSFGELIPGVLRIPNVAAFGIEFILLGRAGWSAFSPEARAYTGTTLPSTDATPDRFYYEAGLGLNRLLFFFRFDLSARFSQRERPRLFFTVSGATQ